jgi:hypothetical protein
MIQLLLHHQVDEVLVDEVLLEEALVEQVQEVLAQVEDDEELILVEMVEYKDQIQT